MENVNPTFVLEDIQKDSTSEAFSDEKNNGQENSSYERKEFFKTKEEFQKQFDYEWNKRYKDLMSELDRIKEVYGEMEAHLAEFLGVEKEEAAEELKQRVTYSHEPSQEPEPDHGAEEELLLQEELKEQAEKVQEEIGEFDLDAAMENQEFEQAVLFFYQQDPKTALQKALRAVSFDLYQNALAKKVESEVTHKLQEIRNRVPEGAVMPAYTVGVKPIDVNKLSSDGILQLQNRILKGEKINLN